MIKDQGEVAIILEEDGQGGYRIQSYALPADGTFSEEDKRNLYLSEYIKQENNNVKDDAAKTVLVNYLEKYYSEQNQSSGVASTVESMMNVIYNHDGKAQPSETEGGQPETRETLVTKKYKPVAQKIRPVFQDLPDKFRIVRDIKGDPLDTLPKLNRNPPEFTPTGRYTIERKEQFDKVHSGDFLWPEERKMLHHFMMENNEAFAWDDSERGNFKTEFFPPVDIPVIPHTPWVLKNIPIPPGLYPEVCRIIKTKLEAGVYEPSNSSYRSRWFCVLKKDGKSLRLVHSLEPLNAVTIAHSGLPPATDALATHFSGRACGGMFDLYVGYDERLLAETSRDLTTFQTPFGALRLVTLPMGWTNSVPIFHEDVTYILKEEIPEVTIPYIDDVPVRGPATRYELPEGGYETIPENKGIRRFVMEHFENANRVVHRMKYAGGTFSGFKSVICAAEITVVGHLCTYEGRKPETERMKVIELWGPCKDLHDVRAFLGTIGVCRMFIETFAKKAEPINDLCKKGVPFVWGPAQEKSMAELKKALRESEALVPLDYENNPNPVVLAVDTSWKAVGFYIYQDHQVTGQRQYARFGSITLNEREARMSQPKRELYGLLRALEAASYWLLGARKLIVETDAKYLSGMLRNPGMGPNATVNRWIDKILMFHFKLQHVQGKTFGADGLSRRDPQPGDEIFPNSEEHEDEPLGPLEVLPDPNGGEPPLEFESFKDQIDSRGGYVQQLALDISDFQDELDREIAINEQHVKIVKERIDKDPDNEESSAEQKDFLRTFVVSTLIPGLEARYDEQKEEQPYQEAHRSFIGQSQDEFLLLIRGWLKNPIQIEGYSDKKYRAFVRFAKGFFLDKEDRLYRRSIDSRHKLVVDKTHRMYMMRSAHDAMGHRGAYATQNMLTERFWWPEIERDVHWYVKTCHRCQERTKRVVEIPPTVTHTPSIFQRLHADTVHMTPKSNGCKYIVHGRCALSSWVEGRPLKAETARTVGIWLFEEVICRWGCLEEIITDNGSVFLAAVKWLEEKYGIKGIRISPYNSKANGRIERPHWDVIQMLTKCCGPKNLSKWYWFFYQVLWADRITVRKRFGCSPFFMVTGAHPILPLDVQEATWLVKLPDRMLTTEELIGYRARALAKHRTHVAEMRQRVTLEKMRRVAKYELSHRHKISNRIYKPGDLVLIRNSMVSSSLNSKMKPRYLGPMIIVRRTKGGSYIVAELDGSVSQNKIGAFRVIPYFAREKIDLPDDFDRIIDADNDLLSKIENQGLEDNPEKRDYYFEGVNLDGSVLNESEDLENSEESSDEEA